MSVIYLFRHGQASFGADNYDQLSEVGKQQSSLLGDYLKREAIHFDQVFAGTLRRQVETYQYARIDFVQLPDLQSITQLNEHQGPEVQQLHFQEAIKQDSTLSQLVNQHGMNHALVKKEVIKLLFRLNIRWAIGELDSGEYEDFMAFRKRISEVVELLKPEFEKNQTIGIFTSGGVIATMLGIALNLDSQTIMETNWQIRNASITEIHYAKNRMYLRTFNTIPHLSDKKLITYV